MGEGVQEQQWRKEAGGGIGATDPSIFDKFTGEFEDGIKRGELNTVDTEAPEDLTNEFNFDLQKDEDERRATELADKLKQQMGGGPTVH